MKHVINGRVIIETTNGITIEYMGRLILVALYSKGTKPILMGEGLVLQNKLNLDGEIIIRSFEYRVTKRGVLIFSFEGIDGVTRQLKFLPRTKEGFAVNIVDFLLLEQGDEEYVKRISC